MWEIKLQGPHDKLARCPSATLVCELPYKIKPLGRTEQSQNFCFGACMQWQEPDVSERVLLCGTTSPSEDIQPYREAHGLASMVSFYFLPN